MTALSQAKPAPPAPAIATDEHLLAAFAAGRDDALGELAARYEPLLLGLARGLLGGDHELARDAVQDSWLRIIRGASKAGHFAGRSTVKTWLYRIVINRCLDLRKQRGPREGAGGSGEAATLDGLDGERFDPHRVVLTAAPTAPDAAAQSSESRSRLRHALATLKEDARLLLLLCYHEGLTHREAAAVLGIPMGTLKSRLNTALTVLRTCLGQDDQETRGARERQVLLSIAVPQSNATPTTRGEVDQ